MSEMHFPWLEAAVLVLLVGALWVSRQRNATAAWKVSLAVSGLALLATSCAWEDFYTLHSLEAHDKWSLSERFLGPDVFVIDHLSAPLLPAAALMYLLTIAATASTKIWRFSFAWTLVSEALLLAMLSCQQPWGVILLLVAAAVPPLLELRARRRSTRVYALHMALFAGLLILGWGLVENAGSSAFPRTCGVCLVMAAVFIRSGIVPLHCWMTDLFEHATFGTALLYVMPMAGAYAAVRLLLPLGDAGVLNAMALIALFTSVYAAGMALVQREARRFFCYLFISHSALVLVGLAIATPMGLTGALCVWLSIGLALTGFGLALRAIEARTGRLSLADYHGLGEHMPLLAGTFLFTGLASVGFPGTFGFIGTELLVEGAVEAYPYIGMAVVAAAALNGIAVMQAYFLLFTGTRHASSVSLQARGRERFAMLVLALLIFGGGVFPQPGVVSRHEAALEIFAARQARLAAPLAPQAPLIASKKTTP